MRATLEVPGRGPITTYESASKEEFNVLSRLAHAPAVKALADDLWRQRKSIEALTRQHLSLGKHDTCCVLEPQKWIRGGFNICVLLHVESAGRLPLPRIGAFQFNPNGTITLTNRPLSCSIVLLENDGAPRTMQPNDTYNCTDAFASDMLTFHDQRFLRQPNAIFSDGDCRGQMAVKALLRVFAHRYIRRERRHGPFLLQLTDLHASNVFVDDDWNVTCLIDLEWLCALPAEMLCVPYWLTGCSIDEIQEERYDEFNEIRQEFMRVFQEQERRTRTEHGIAIADVMHDMWDSKGVWFWYCLASINAMYFLLEGRLCPEDSLSTNAEKVLSRFWCEDSETVVQTKLADRKDYDVELKRVFGE
ncbi:hypothetical protein C8A00DRAFT_28772 [Chaetomidium leptoderma]|uniref:Aminoglycoside phosphotransferase domain-containing protein n=1 Tax=Chaetomidium leptoderma TaxID=669021 RepID=A0AAN6VV06_9PEZI|nr:hypothetical protein C8A00DRAFT_28772 [Chaetomidium leptoderma]